MPTAANDRVILLVEDNPADADLMAEMLRVAPDATFRIERCASLAEASALCREGPRTLFWSILTCPTARGWQPLSPG